MRRALAALWREDRVVAWVVAAFVLVQLTAIGWDLPGSFGWENDGVAPRDLFGGLAFNLTPGKGHRYPLFHYLLLGLLCLPILGPAALAARDFSKQGLMDAMLSPVVMTGVSLVAKLLAVFMSAVSILLLARIARRTLSRRAGRWAALFAVTSLSVAYYGRVSNLDGPYLFWTVLAVDRLLTVAEHGRRKDYLWFGFFVAASVATKDQAYAAWMLTGPLFLVLLPWRRPTAFAAARAHWGHLVRGAGVGAVTLAVLGGGALNPTGFVARIHLLTGANSQDWRAYEATAGGVVANLQDLGALQADFWWPWPLVALAWLGLLVAATAPRGDAPLERRLWRLLPALVGLSHLVFFTLVVARAEHRFVLPVGLWLALYGGAACDRLLEAAGARWRRAVTAVLALLLVWAAGHTLRVHLTQWGDARHGVVAWLAQLPPGSVVETYGILVAQPHFDVSADAPYRVRRPDLKPASQRNPMPGVEELEAAPQDALARAPDVIVLTEGWVARFLPHALGGGQVVAKVRAAYRADEPTSRFFEAAWRGDLPGYRLALDARPAIPAWLQALGLTPIRVHGSVGADVRVLQRTTAPP